MRLIIMGTGPFAVPMFQAILTDGHDVPIVVTRPARPVRGRKQPPSNPMRGRRVGWYRSMGAGINQYSGSDSTITVLRGRLDGCL